MARLDFVEVANGNESSASFKPGPGVFTVGILGGAGTVKIQKAHEDAPTVWFDVSKNADGDVASYAVTAGVAVTQDVYEGSGKWLYKFVTSNHSADITLRATQG